MKETIFSGNYAQNSLKQLLTLLVFCLALQNTYASSLLPCGVSLDHTNVICPLDETGSITVSLSTDEVGTFELEWLQAPMPIPPDDFTVTLADIDSVSGLFQGDIVTYNGLSEGLYYLMVTTPTGNTCAAQTIIIVEENCAPCEIIASASPPICSDNSTPNEPSDDTFTFDVTVISNGTGTAFNDDFGNSGLPYGAVLSYGPFPISGGDVVITFSDAEDAECTTVVGVTPPATCSVDPPLAPDIQPMLNIVPNDNCGTTNDVYGDVLLSVLPPRFRLFSCPDDTPSPPSVTPQFDENGEPSIPGMAALPDTIIQIFEGIPSTSFCIENLTQGRYYLLVWDELFFNFDIECFIIPPPLELNGPVNVPQDKTGEKNNVYFFIKGGTMPYTPTFYECPEGTSPDFQPETNEDGTPNLEGMSEISENYISIGGFLCIQNMEAGQHYVLIEDAAGRWKWICYKTPKELQASLEDFVPVWEGDTRIYVDVCGGKPDYEYFLFTCPDPTPDELPTPEYAADGTPMVEGMTLVPDFTFTQVTPERICIDLPAGRYYLLVRDSGGRCTWVCIDIPIVEPLDAELLEIVPFDDEHVRVYVRVTGGVPPYLFQPYICPDPGVPLPDPTFPDGLPNVPMDPFHHYDWMWNGPDTICFTFPKDLERIYILFWGEAFCWDWVCIDIPPPDFPDEYCTPEGIDSSVSSIEQVTFCDIDNISGNDGGYGNYTNMVGNVVAGQAPQISLDAQFNQLLVGVRWHVWIDFNQDGIFDVSERVVSTQNTGMSVTDSVNIPLGASLGHTRMRVKMVTGRSIGANPCGNSERGEVEDYTVNISSGTGLIAPPSDFGNFNLSDTNLGMKIFPNPIREQATIEFELSENSSVTLFVTDVNGRHFMLVDNELMLKGRHQANFDGSDLPAGIYYCTLKVGRAVKVEQITLVK